MKKKFGVLSIAAVLICMKTFAQIPDWAWAKSAGFGNSIYANNIVSDASGNLYFTGFFNSATISFDSIVLNNVGSGTFDLYIVKYDKYGNVIWAKSAGGDFFDQSKGIAIDNFGNVFITGNFKSSFINFGTLTLTNTNTNLQYDDVFIAKYDSSGNVLWAKSAGSAFSDSGEGIAVDNSGNVFITGSYGQGNINFGSVTLTNNGASDIFIAKYNSNGTLIWAKGAGGANGDNATRIALDNFGNAYVSGSFSSSSINFGVTNIVNNGNIDFLILKYNSIGNIVWAKSGGNIGNEVASDIVVDNDSNVYITGWFDSNTITFGTSVISTNGMNDCFILKYNSVGNIIWVKSFGGIAHDLGYGMDLDSNNNIYIVGKYQSDMVWGNDTLINSGYNDVFVVKYDSSGNSIWSKKAGGNWDDRGFDISVVANNVCYVTGYISSDSVSFNSTTLYSNNNSNESFIAKLTDTTFITPIKVISNLHQISIYPNPTTSAITIKTNVPSQLYILNILGETLITKYVQNNSIIDISHFAKGIYIVKNSNGMCLKLLKE